MGNSERKNASVAKRVLTDLISSIPTGIIGADTAGKIVLFNQCAERLFGFRRSEVLGKPLDMLVARVDAEVGDSIFRDAVESSESIHDVEAIAFAKDDHTFPAGLQMFRVEENNGSSLVVAIVTNLAQYKKEQDWLKQLHRAVEQSASTVVITDENAHIEYVNPKFTELTGYTLDEVKGKTPSIVKSGNTPRATYDDLWNTIRSGTEWRGELQNKRKDGSLYWEAITISPILEDGVVKQYIAVEEDITDRREAEALQEESFARLAQAQKLESLSVMAAGIAHDFNNILMSVIGNAELGLMDASEDGNTSERLEEIQASAKKAAQLTDRLLTLTGQNPIEKGRLRLSDLTQEYLEYWRSQLSKGVTVEFEHTSNFPFCEADASQLQQVLFSFLSNAQEAVETNEGSIVVRTGVVQLSDGSSFNGDLTQPLPAGSYVYLEVTDTGCGIEIEEVGKVFDPFYSTKFPGRGLGLAVAQGIAHSHGGALTLNSRPAEGTTVRIVLPCAGDASESSVKGVVPAPEQWRGSGTILVVDDDPSVLSVCSQALERFGFEVMAVSEGSEVVSTFGDNVEQISAVVLDVTMPKYDVEEVAQQLRTIEPSVKILLCSGYSDTDAIAKLSAWDNVIFLRKPYGCNELLDAVHSLVSSGKVAVEASANV